MSLLQSANDDQIHSVTRLYPYEYTLTNKRICRGNILAGSKKSAIRILKAKMPEKAIEIQVGKGCPYIAKSKTFRSFLSAWPITLLFLLIVFHLLQSYMCFGSVNQRCKDAIWSIGDTQKKKPIKRLRKIILKPVFFGKKNCDMNFLDWLGSGFVYKSPKPYDGFKRFLVDLPSRKLRSLADTNAHYSKKKLVELYLQKNALTEIQDQWSSQ